MLDNPYVVPPFVPKSSKKQIKVYSWWSWHPCYPYWSKSCWGGSTCEEAIKALNSPFASSLKLYHNKLIEETESGDLIEVMDAPCPKLQVWQEIARDPKGWRRPTDAQPIENWEKL